LSKAGDQQFTFECVLAAEIEDDLRRLYVQNFPEVERTYRELYPHESTAVLLNSLRDVDGKLKESLELYDAKGALSRIHGDLAALVDAHGKRLRCHPNGRPIIPEHDLLCAGFPCQPFSKSGNQRGFEDTRGTLFYLLALVIEHRKPDLVFLENVGNFERHDGGNTWRRVRTILEELGYEVTATEHVSSNRKASGLLSPHHVGLPHHRGRFFIIAQKIGSDRFPALAGRHPFPKAYRGYRTVPKVRSRLEKAAADRLHAILSKEPIDGEREIRLALLSQDRCAAVEHWGTLLNELDRIDLAGGKPTWRDSMPSFPIWGYEFDPWQWYPAKRNPAELLKRTEQLPEEHAATLASAASELRDQSQRRVDIYAYAPNGVRSFLSHRILSAEDVEAWVKTWPAYAGKRKTWPRWKQRFIEQNRRFALQLWATLDPSWFRAWIDELYTRFPAASHQKLEWNCKGEPLRITEHLLQFRPSGIRVQRRRHIPALVAMTTTQIPVVRAPLEVAADGSSASGLRHLLPSEALQLQGFPADWKRPNSRERTFEALGNAVHAELIAEIVSSWLDSPREESEVECTVDVHCKSLGPTAPSDLLMRSA
jgi:DNA (cytosine-5)-methyltransferase 1